MTVTDTPKTVWPTLNYADAPAAIRLLVDGFGFTEALVVTGDDPQVVEHAELRWPEGGAVMLGTADREGNPFSQRPTGAASCYVVTDAVDDVFASATKAGATVVREPEDQDYGGRVCAVRDPEGNLWSFGSYRGTPASTDPT